MQTIVERPAALDVHKAQVTACVRIPDGHGHRQEQIAEFATTVRGLLALRDWLAGHRVARELAEVRDEIPERAGLIRVARDARHYLRISRLHGASRAPQRNDGRSAGVTPSALAPAPALSWRPE